MLRTRVEYAPPGLILSSTATSRMTCCKWESRRFLVATQMPDVENVCVVMRGQCTPQKAATGIYAPRRGRSGPMTSTRSKAAMSWTSSKHRATLGRRARPAADAACGAQWEDSHQTVHLPSWGSSAQRKAPGHMQYLHDRLCALGLASSSQTKAPLNRCCQRSCFVWLYRHAR